MAAYNVSMKIY